MRRPEQQPELFSPESFEYRDTTTEGIQTRYLYDIALSMRQIADFLAVWMKR